MTTRDDFERRLHSWLAEREWDREPELLLEEVLARTARTRRRPAWQIPERWFSMSAITSRLTLPAAVPWRALALAVLLVLALVAGAVIIAGSQAFRPAPPFGLAANGAIAFSRGGDVLFLDDPGATPRAVLSGPDLDQYPLFSPDGSHLAVLRGADTPSASVVWTRYDGSDPRVILKDAPSISWAEIGPRGDVVAVQQDAEPGVIRIVRTDGSGSTTIDTGLPKIEGPIFRPPSGAQLTFRGVDGAGDQGIYLVNVDGSGLVRLDLDAGFQADGFYDVNRAYYFNQPSWTADGSRLAYHTLEPDDLSPAGPGFRIHLADVGADGRVLSEQILEFDQAMDDEYAPIWLPTGNAIVYQSIEGNEYRLWLAGLDAAGPPRDLGIVATDEIPAVLSPDGTKVLAVVPVSGAEPAVQLVDLPSGDIQTLDLGASDVVWQRRAP